MRRGIGLALQLIEDQPLQGQTRIPKRGSGRVPLEEPGRLAADIGFVPFRALAQVAEREGEQVVAELGDGPGHGRHRALAVTVDVGKQEIAEDPKPAALDHRRLPKAWIGHVLGVLAFIYLFTLPDKRAHDRQRDHHVGEIEALAAEPLQVQPPHDVGIDDRDEEGLVHGDGADDSAVPVGTANSVSVRTI